MDNVFSCYACHQTAIDTFINYLLQSDDPNDESIQMICARQAGISLGDLSYSDCRYIENEVNRLWYD